MADPIPTPTPAPQTIPTPTPTPAPEPLDADKIGAAAIADWAKRNGFDDVKAAKAALKSAAEAAKKKPTADPEPKPIDADEFALHKGRADAADNALAEAIAEQVAESSATVKAALKAVPDFDDLPPIQQRAALKQAKAMAAALEAASATATGKPATKPAVPGHTPVEGGPDSVKAQMDDLYKKAMQGDRTALAAWQQMKAKHPTIISSRTVRT